MRQKLARGKNKNLAEIFPLAEEKACKFNAPWQNDQEKMGLFSWLFSLSPRVRAELFSGAIAWDQTAPGTKRATVRS
jgi:hypothetical protein